MLKFQFHKGAIRTYAVRTDNVSAFNFNSIKVRLELQQRFLQDDCLINFNSIKVRLELQRLESAASVHGFQFHKGAIRTSHARQLETVKEGFQFHKGAIRTLQLFQRDCSFLISIP